jgi:intracellular sulfur oxidation DsrE/DsrF family protein
MRFTYLLLLLLSPVAIADRIGNMAPVLSDGYVVKPGDPPKRETGENDAIVIDVVLHDRKEILGMLKRAEALAMTPNPVERPRQIALVLHGPEIEHFRISKYQNNQDIVDLAAKLDAFNVIDVKMCNTMMNVLEVDRREIPAFIEIVPYGPAEVERLQQQGFIKL